MPKHLELDIDQFNPYALLRKHFGLTQTTVAEQINVSEQYIRRLEQGLVSGPKGALAGFYYNLAAERGMTLPQLQRYISGQIILLCNQHVKLYSGKIAFNNKHEFEEVVDDWFDFWVTAKRYNAPLEPKPRTIYEFCRRLVVHPYVVQRYLQQERDAVVPLSVAQAMGQAGHMNKWLEVLNGFR